MALSFRWVGEDQLDRVALARLQSYASIGKELEIYQRRIREDRRAVAGDFLLAEEGGVAIGTTTSLSMAMWVRGASIPCQGVAWVGTIKTHRRRTTDPAERGIASKLMHETLRKARERGQVVSALMPFRASFYEHFGYGIVEHQNEWTIPLSILPVADCSGFEFAKDSDIPLIKQCRQRMVQRGQCDIERSDASWELYQANWPEGFCVVDRAGDAVRSWMSVHEIAQPGKVRSLRVADACWDSPAAQLRQLHFLASLRDQYDVVTWILPADLPLNRLLKESQLPHRPVSHPTARVAPNTRMQVRILDHGRFLEALHLPSDVSGRVNVLIHEPEATHSALSIEISDGRATVKPSAGEPDLVCDASVWASITCGELRPSEGMQVSGLKIANHRAISILRAFCEGPAPFSTEYF